MPGKRKNMGKEMRPIEAWGEKELRKRYKTVDIMSFHLY